MSNKTWYTCLTGLAFLIVMLISFGISGNEITATKDSVADIAKKYHDDNSTLWISAGLEVIGSALLVYFGAHLKNAFAAAQTLGPVILAGTLAIAVGLAFDATLTIALLDATHKPKVAIDQGTIQTLAFLYNNDFAPMVLGTALYATAAGLATIRHGVLPKWLGVIGILLGVVAVTPIGFVGFIAMGVWTGVASVLLALQAKKA
jgi:hypothetical protein